MAGGRPTDYNPKVHPTLARYLVRDGFATIKDLAREMRVSQATIKNWKRDYPEFLAALKDENREVDGQVEDSLLKRALGFTYEETEVSAGVDGRAQKMRKTTKYVAPDVAACIIWLKNRKREQWRDRPEAADQPNTGTHYREVLSKSAHAAWDGVVAPDIEAETDVEEASECT